MKKILAMALMALVASNVAFGQSTYAWRGADESVAIYIVKKNTDTVTGFVAAASMFITNTTDGTASKTIVLTPTKTVNTVVGEINALTNASGQFIYEAYVWGSISTETVSNKLLAGAISLQNYVEDGDIKWDTSTCLFYSVVPDKAVGGRPVGAYGITRVLGDPTGTGNVTVNIYEDDTMLYQKTIESPIYRLSTTNDALYVVENTVTCDIDVGDVRIGAGKKGLIKVTRASTATTGGVGAATKR